MPNPENIKGKGFDKRPENINRKGQPKKIPKLDVLLADVIGDAEMTKLIKALYDAAVRGNVRAAEALLDRAYGKAKQSVDVTTDGEKISNVNVTYINKLNEHTGEPGS